MEIKKNRRTKFFIMLLGLVILLVIGGSLLWQRDDGWIPIERYDMDMEGIISVEVSAKNEEDIAFIMQWDGGVTPRLIYLPTHYIVQSQMIGQNSFQHRENDWDSRYGILELEVVEVEVFNALTGESVKIIDVLNLLEELDERITEGYRLEPVETLTRVYTKDEYIMFSWTLREIPREGLEIDDRSSLFLTMNYNTGELEMATEYPLTWRAARARLDEKGIEYEMQMRIFASSRVTGAPQGDRNIFVINGITCEPRRRVYVTSTDFPGIAYISLMTTSLPEVSESLYSRFPGLKEFRGQEDLRVRIFMTGYPTPEEILEMLMEDGREITFEGLFMRVDGEEYPINSFEDHLEMVDRSWWEIEGELE